MKWLLPLCVLLLASCAQSDSSKPVAASSNRSPERKPPYVYCNVYLQDACFGVAGGDSLQMKIPIDFTMYEATLPSGVKAEIYYGTNPDIPKSMSGEKSWRSADGAFRIFNVKQPDGSTISNYVFAPAHSRIGNVVHVRVSAPTGSANVVKSFIANFRPCIAEGPSLHCRDDSLFGGGDETASESD